MRISRPARDAVFTIAGDATWPAIVFETDAEGPHTWRWTISWKTFSQSGRAETPGNTWDAGPVLNGLGGLLVVRAKTPGGSAGLRVKLVGTNPGEGRIKDYLADKTDGSTMLAIVGQESKFKHFRNNGEPVKSFDNGYGLTQLTNPRPTYTQAWHWQRNLDAGLALYARKKAEATAYLSAAKRTYTAAQLERETVSRWNGGHYHVWDGKAGAWVRRSDVLCDTATGNIGWDMTDADNSGKTEAELHKRDAGGYGSRTKDSKWRYYGACYADHVLG